MVITSFSSRLIYSALSKFLGRLLGKKTSHAVLVQLLKNFVYPVWGFIFRGDENYNSTKIAHVNGLSIVYRPRLLSDRVILFTNWEPYVKRLFSPKKGDIVVDVGAHIGCYTLEAARLVGDHGKVVAIEPDLRNYEILSRNVKLNKLTNVVALDIALGAYEGTQTFYAYSDPLRSSFEYTRQAKETKIKMMTLDELLPTLNISKVNWLKIDVEKSDLSVLQGASKSLGKTSKIIVETTNPRTLEILQSKGFKLRHLFDKYFFAEKPTHTYSGPS